MGGSFSALISGGGALADALSQQQDDMVREVLAENPKLASSVLTIRDGNTAAHLAAGEGRLDYLKLLLDAYRQGREAAGKKCGDKQTARLLNKRNLHGQTPLMLACKYGHDLVVTWLLQNGGNPMLFDQIHSRVCLHYAALYGAPQCISALFAEDAFVRMSSGPALLRNAHVLDSQGFHRYIDVRAAMGFAAIHMAASQGHWQAVVMLLKHGASLAVRCYGVLRADFSVPARWKPNSTPLHIAAARGSTSMVKHMLQSFAEQMLAEPATPDVRLMRDFADMRPVDIARAYGFQRIAALLDPTRPVELLAYVTSGHGRLKMGPASLSALMARLLRSQLLAQLEELEPALSKRRAALGRVPSAKLPARAASLRRKASAALMAASGSERGLGSFTTVAPAAVAAGEFGERQLSRLPSLTQLLPAPSVSQPSATPGTVDPFGASGAVRTLSLLAPTTPLQPAPQQPSLSAASGGGSAEGRVSDGRVRDSQDDSSRPRPSVAFAAEAQVQHFSRSSSAAVSSSNNSVTAQSPFATAADGLPAEFVDDFSEPYAPHAGDVNSAGGGLTDDVINSSNEEGNGGGWHAATRQGSLLTMSVRRITLAQPHGEQGQPSGTDEVGLNTDEGAIHCHALGSEANASRIAFDSQPETAGEPAVSAFQSHRDGSGDSDGDWNLDEWPSVTTPTAAEIAAAAGSNGSMSTGRSHPSSSSLARGAATGTAPESSSPSRRSFGLTRDSTSARRSSMLLQAVAGRSASLLRRNSGRRGSEMILDSRLGDSYTGGRGLDTPDPLAGGGPATAAAAEALGADVAAAAHQGSAQTDLTSTPEDHARGGSDDSGRDVVFAELASRGASVQVLVRRASANLSRAPSAASIAGDECDICFDAPLEVAIAGCQHTFCASCLRGICESQPDKTPRCPFCRRVVDRVVAAASHRPTSYGNPSLCQHKEGGSGESSEEVSTALANGLGLDDACDAAIAAQHPMSMPMQGAPLNAVPVSAAIAV